MSFARVEPLIRAKMEQRGLPAAAVNRFLSLARRAMEEESAYVPLDSVSKPDPTRIMEPPSDPDELNRLESLGAGLLSGLVVIKLNGGRSTTMGGEVPKGTLIAKDGRTYLDIVAGQMRAFRERWNGDTLLVLMNSFFTHEPTIRHIADMDVPVETFIQNQAPRLLKETFEPLDTGTEDDWAPPGHGDVYDSLKWSGLLDRFIAEGRTTAFISNIDNLAAAPEPWILGLMRSERAPFLMEVTARTDSDRKGGTLVMRDGRLDLLEIAQVSPGERERFMDIQQFPIFNTNSIWVDLKSLSQALDEGGLHMPVILNVKSVAGREVVQIETAMGAAVGAFADARGLKVSRDRFFPTKTVEHLFVLQSDACVLDDMDRVRSNPERPSELPLRPMVSFDPGFLDSPLRMGERFEDPTSLSLVKARSLSVKGEVFFERDVKVEGDVTVEVPHGVTYRVERGSILKDGKYP